jgi:hypothetical protein
VKDQITALMDASDHVLLYDRPELRGHDPRLHAAVVFIRELAEALGVVDDHVFAAVNVHREDGELSEILAVYLLREGAARLAA